MALEGDADRAEAAARKGLANETEGQLRVTWGMAHAHALAAMGRRDEALAALRELRQKHAEMNVLERVARHAGPASPLAETLLIDNDAPYR